MPRYKTDRTWFSCLVTTSGQEIQRVYSYNPGDHTRCMHLELGQKLLCVRQRSKQTGRQTDHKLMSSIQLHVQQFLDDSHSDVRRTAQIHGQLTSAMLHTHANVQISEL